MLCRRLTEALLGAAEQLAMGYHAYRLGDKLGRYRAAREALAGALADALLAGGAGESPPQELASLAADIEGEALSALGGLIRTMERKGTGKKKGQQEHHEEPAAQ